LKDKKPILLCLFALFAVLFTVFFMVYVASYEEENEFTQIGSSEFYATPQGKIYALIPSGGKFELKGGKKPKIACMGLAFKPDIDDLRESPAVFITRELKKQGFEILAVEPNIKSHKDFEIINYEKAVDIADIVVFLVAHKEFKELKIEKEVLDFCGIFR